jgi:hypothetical protein
MMCGTELATLTKYSHAKTVPQLSICVGSLGIPIRKKRIQELLHNGHLVFQRRRARAPDSILILSECDKPINRWPLRCIFSAVKWSYIHSTRVNCLLRWRYISVAVMGALLGFSGQFIADICSGWTGFELVCGNPGPSLLTQIRNGTFDRGVAHYYPAHFAEARTLAYELNLLIWLTVQGETACRTASITSFLLAVSLYANDNRQRREAAQEAVTF